MSDREIDIVIRAKSLSDAIFNKVTGQVKGLRDEVKNAAGSFSDWSEQAQRTQGLVSRFIGDDAIARAHQYADAVRQAGGAANLTASEQQEVNRAVTAAIQKYEMLGREAPDALVKVANATKRVPEHLSLVDRGVNVLRSSFAQMAGAFAVGNLIERGVSGLVSFGKEAIDAAGNIIDLSNQTDLTTDTIQRMQYVGKQTGVALEKFTNAALNLGVKLAEGNTATKDSVEDLGLAWEKLRSQSPDEQFNRVIKSLEAMQNPQERNRIALELFGGKAKDVLKAVGDNYTELADKAKVSSRDQLEALDHAADAWDAFVENQKTGLRSWLGEQVISFQKSQKLTDAQREQMRQLLFAGFDAQQALRLATPGDDINLAVEKNTKKTRESADAKSDAADAARKLAAAEKESAQIRVDAILASYEETRKAGESYYAMIARANDSSVQVGIEGLRFRYDTEVNILHNLTSEWLVYAGAINQVSGLIRNGIDSAPGTHLGGKDLLGEPLQAYLGVDKAVSKEAQSAMNRALNFGQELSRTIVGAIQGGGDVGESVGAMLGSSIGASLGKSLAKKLAASLGETLGGALGGMLGPLGAIGGQLLGGLVDKLFGHKGRDEVTKFFDTFEGGAAELNQRLVALGREDLWVQLTQKVGKNNVAQAQSAIGAITAMFDAQRTKIQDSMDAAKEAAQVEIDAQSKVIDEIKGRRDELASHIKQLNDQINAEAEEAEMGVQERLDRDERDRAMARQAAIDAELKTAEEKQEENMQRLADVLKDLADSLKKLTEKTWKIPIEFSYQNGIEPPDGSGPDVPEHASGAYIRRDHLAYVHSDEMIGGRDFFTDVLSDTFARMGARGGGETTVRIPVMLDGRQITEVVARNLGSVVKAYGL